MRGVLCVVVAVAPFAVGCAEDYDETEPATPLAAQPGAVVVPQQMVGYARAPAGTVLATPPQVVYVERPYEAPPPSPDPVWNVPTYYVPPIPPTSEYYVPPPHPPPRHTISLGFIGDWPLGSSGDPPAPAWWRPFPASWEARFHGSYGYGGYGRRWR